jgi:hypothetical protein
MEIFISRPEIAVDMFLPIFVVSTLVLVFGVFYAGIITLTKMGYLSKRWTSVGYLFWALQTYCLYELSIMIQSETFTTKVLMITMVAYLFVPHLYFRLIEDSEKRYEESQNKAKKN